MRRAVHWYRDHDRLHTGDEIAMAADALAAYRADITQGCPAGLRHHLDGSSSWAGDVLGR